MNLSGCEVTFFPVFVFNKKLQVIQESQLITAKIFFS